MTFDPGGLAPTMLQVFPQTFSLRRLTRGRRQRRDEEEEDEKQKKEKMIRGEKSSAVLYSRIFNSGSIALKKVHMNAT